MDFQHGIFFDLAKQQPHTEGNAALPSGKQTWQFHFICFWCEKHECIAKQQYFELPGWIRGRCMPLNRAYVWETSHGLKNLFPSVSRGFLLVLARRQLISFWPKFLTAPSIKIGAFSSRLLAGLLSPPKSPCLCFPCDTCPHHLICRHRSPILFCYLGSMQVIGQVPVERWTLWVDEDIESHSCWIGWSVLLGP